MRSKSKNVKIPIPIVEGLEESYVEWGYRSVNAAIVGLCRYALMVEGKHSVTAPISQLPNHMQDEIDDALLHAVKTSTKRQRGQLLKALLHEVANDGDKAGLAENLHRVIQKG